MILVTYLDNLAVVQLVETLRYKPEGRGEAKELFVGEDLREGQVNFSLSAIRACDSFAGPYNKFTKYLCFGSTDRSYEGIYFGWLPVWVLSPDWLCRKLQ
jgi:hypothetical protein